MSHWWAEKLTSLQCCFYLTSLASIAYLFRCYQPTSMRKSWLSKVICLVVGEEYKVLGIQIYFYKIREILGYGAVLLLFILSRLALAFQISLFYGGGEKLVCDLQKLGGMINTSVQVGERTQVGPWAFAKLEPLPCSSYTDQDNGEEVLCQWM